jgi:deoxyribonucleoside regulator
MANEKNILEEDRERLQLIVQICKLYFEEKETQQRISEMLALSRTQIVRYIEMGRRLGIVQTRVLDPFSTRKDLEERIKRRFDLKAVRVIQNSDAEDPLLSHSLARVGCDFLRNVLGPNSVVGVGWGKSVSALVELFPAHVENRSSTVWVPLIGGIGETDPIFQVNGFVLTMREKVGGVCCPLYAPALADSREMREMLLSMESLKPVVRGWANLDIAILGIGALIPSRTARSPSVHARYFPFAEREAIYSSSAVGDILSRYYNADGNICDIDVNSRIIGMDVESLRRVPFSIGIAGGAPKAGAILGALTGKYINVLITDETAALLIVGEESI